MNILLILLFLWQSDNPFQVIAKEKYGGTVVIDSVYSVYKNKDNIELRNKENIPFMYLQISNNVYLKKVDYGLHR